MGGMEIKNVIVFIALSLIVAVSAKSVRTRDTPYQRYCTNANCPTYEDSSSIVPNGNECESFCICTCDGAIYMKCPDGLQYNDKEKKCDWPSNVGCRQTTPAPPATSPPPTGSCDKVKPQCPEKNGVNATLLPNPDDCGSYCVCDWGNAIWMPCPAGLEFNPTLHVCDWPLNAGCSHTPTGNPPTTTTTRPTGHQTTPNHGHNGCDKVQSQCPAENSGDAILLPNPEDCGSYCVCDWGNAIWMPCPAGLEFNPTLHVCDWPSNAGCSHKPTGNPPTTTTTRPTGHQTTPNHKHNGCDKVQSQCPAENSGDAILLPNPDDCGSYCVCDWGNAIWMPCPAGLEFNPTLHVCDWPSNAGCSHKPTGNPPTTTTTRPTGHQTTPNHKHNGCDKVQSQCPAENSGDAILLPNPDDCGSYCVCDWGNAIWMPCPAGLEFNPTLHVCDWPSNAGCSNKPTGNPPTTTTTRPTGHQTTPNHKHNGCDKVQSQCPAENSGDAILLPNPDDCGSYCVCDWGNAIWMPCPAGLEFNPTLHVCDWPSNAGCSHKPTGNPPTTTTTRPTGHQTTPNHKHNGCDKVQSQCPAENSGDAILLPNPDDCGSYCVCDWGNAIWMPCPAGLEFNPTLHVCDWPSNAGCSNKPTGNPPTTTTTRPTGHQTTPNHKHNGCDKVQSQCPAENSGDAILLPNPDDCGSYCVCDWGNAIWMPCPAGLEFNPTLHVCDWPSNAGCSHKPTGNPPTTTTTRPTGHQTTPNHKHNGCDKVQSQCPAENSGDAILLPNPEDCGSYCVCDWGNAIWMPCPAGLEFNPTLHVCDWPSNAGCSHTPTGNPPTTTTHTPTGHQTTPNHKHNGCDKVQSQCPAENSGDAILLPNPDDCGSYCVCDWGNAIWMPCPAGLEFNPTLHVCDWPSNAGCSHTPTGNPPTTTTHTPTGHQTTPNHKHNGCDKVQSQCPAENSGDAILLPNPDDCGSYCVCDWGNAIWMPCPAGLEFNPTLHVCDWPSNAGCSHTPTGNLPTTTTTRPTGHQTTPNHGHNGCDKVQSQCPAENSGDAILLPNPVDCGSYCVCDWGNAIWMPCPAGLEFNPTLHVCDWPSNAGCSHTPTGNPPTTTTTRPTGHQTTPNHGHNGCDKVQSQCPAENSGDAILLPNPDDCGSYCVCDWGNAIWMPCPAGLEFNPTLHVCDWPSNAGCSHTPTGNPTTTTPPRPTGHQTTPNHGHNGCDKVQSQCPAENSGDAILLPNPDDCGSYCVCDWGNSIWMPCPAGLEFNPTLHVCDWPSNAGCSHKPTVNPTTTTPPRPTGHQTTPNHGHNGCDKVQSQCPAENSGEAILLPNPDDCGSYCVCDWGNAILMPCPAGLEFNPTLHVCDWPSNAGCSHTPTGNPFTTTPPRPTGHKTTPNHGHNGCDKVQSQCPAENSGDAILLPNPEDCGSYCVCDWGNAIWMPCPAGLEFNPTLHVCDWPSNAGCSHTPTRNPPTITPPRPTGHQTTPNHGPNGCDKVQSQCPAENSGDAILLPNPDDCGSYCVCDWGNSIWMPCPAGLEFNPTLHVCDWPSNAGCSLTPTRNPPTTTTHTPTGHQTTPNHGHNGCDKVQSQCPAENSGDAILLPNPDDCGSYCVCDWGNAIWMPCPAGLEFNPTLHVCDWPSDAGCSHTPTRNPPTITPPRPTGHQTTPNHGHNGCDKVQSQCPAENSGNAILLPNPDDCGSYCVCDWGNAIWMPCPAGLEFNPKLMVCDWPSDAGCSSHHAGSSTPNPIQPTGTQPTPKPGHNGCDIVKPQCPAVNTGNAVLLPNPYDCGSYCACDWGNAIWMPCPVGLEFNPKLMVCDWPSDAGCSSNPGDKTTARPIQPTGSQPGTPIWPGSCDKVKPQCPAVNTGNAVLLPNPDDCGSYCACDWGNAIWMPCPAGLEFNPKLMVCDWPADAGCSGSALPPTSSSSLCEGISCPLTNGVNATLFPNPHDCSSYCVCDYGRPFVMPCPSGLQFNPTLKVCDWPQNAGCAIAS